MKNDVYIKQADAVFAAVRLSVGGRQAAVLAWLSGAAVLPDAGGDRRMVFNAQSRKEAGV